MKLQQVLVIINPASGKSEPILSYLQNQFLDAKVIWKAVVTQKPGDVKKFIEEIVSQKHPYDAIVVYGGDGTVMEAAHALYDQSVPLGIIPGGTANVVAKELGIPVDTQAAIRLLLTKESLVTQVDMASVNNRPFTIRINSGVFADMVINTKASDKAVLGQAAYVLTTITELANSVERTIEADIDGKKVSATGIAWVIANSGNIGIPGMSLVPGISMTDGLLDLIVIQKASLNALLAWTAKNLVNTLTIPDLIHWQGRQIIVTIPTKQKLLCDDEVIVENQLTTKIHPESLRIIVPANSNNQ